MTQEHIIDIERLEKEIYYILDKKGNVIDFTEEKTDTLYGTIPVDMSIIEFKQAIDFDNRLFVYKNNTLSSKQKYTDIEKLENQFKVFQKEIAETLVQLQQRISVLEKNNEHVVDVEMGEE